MPFVPGQSGNPAGRPRGCKNKVNRDFDAELLKEGKGLTEELFEFFRKGNPTALRLITERMAPTKRRPIEIELPPLKTPADRPVAVAVIQAALCEGDICTEEASGLIKFVDQALGLERPAAAKAQIVALTKEVVRLGSMIALMAARLDAQFGPEQFLIDKINAESMTATGDGGPADCGEVWPSEPAIDEINAESMAAPAADDPNTQQNQEAASEAAPAAIDQINTESMPADRSAATVAPPADATDLSFLGAGIPMQISPDTLARLRELEHTRERDTASAPPTAAKVPDYAREAAIRFRSGEPRPL